MCYGVFDFWQSCLKPYGWRLAVHRPEKRLMIFSKPLDNSVLPDFVSVQLLAADRYKQVFQLTAQQDSLDLDPFSITHFADDTYKFCNELKMDLSCGTIKKQIIDHLHVQKKELDNGICG